MEPGIFPPTSLHSTQIQFSTKIYFSLFNPPKLVGGPNDLVGNFTPKNSKGAKIIEFRGNWARKIGENPGKKHIRK